MSATALLQKAAQIGAAASNASLLRGFGLAASSSSPAHDTTPTLWNIQPKPENDSSSVAAAGPGLGLGLPSAGNSTLTDLMMGPASAFGSQPMTRDLLGLSRGGGEASTGGLSALLNSFGGGNGFDNITAAAATAYGGGGGGGGSPRDTWEGPSERKPNGPAFL